jgi:proteic killer suppression protein
LSRDRNQLTARPTAAPENEQDRCGLETQKILDTYLVSFYHESERMIRSFECKETERIWHGRSSRKFPADIQDRALRKLRQLDASGTLEDLRNPPGNRLENLKGNRAGQMSIRINDQWRICFLWDNGDATNVEIVDYH